MDAESGKIVMRFKNHVSKLSAALPVACLVAAFLFVPGCGKGDPKPVNDTQAFVSANSDLKSEWDKIADADTANDYATVILNSRKLLPENSLTPEQRSALTAIMTAANTRMMDAVQKGDPAAIKASQEVSQHWR